MQEDVTMQQGRRERVAPKRAMSWSLLLREPSTLSKKAKQRFPWPTQHQAILPIHIVRVEFQLTCHPVKLVHIMRYSREDCLDSWHLKLGPIGCPETSVRNYCYTLCNSPEERCSHLLCSRSLKSRSLLGLFLGGGTTGVWSWLLTSVWCRG